jgi:hypothetical protein
MGRITGARSLGRAVLLAIALSSGAAVDAEAQAALLGPGAAFLHAGPSLLATGPLDDRLASLGYPTFGRGALSIGIGGYRVLSSEIMLGFEGNGLIVGDAQHAGRKVGVGGGYATLGVGYQFDISPRTRFYPRFGVGGGGLAVWIESADSVRFDDVLRDPRRAPMLREPVLSRDGFVFDFGGGLEFLAKRGGGGALIGLRVGYLAAAFDSSWDLVYEGKASGGPDASIAGPYLRVVIGGAWSK